MFSCNELILNCAIIWYVTAKLNDAFAKKGFCRLGALKTNCAIFPCAIKQRTSESVFHIHREDVILVTVGSFKLYIYRYEGKLNGTDNAVVIISYPEDAFHNQKYPVLFMH